MLQYPLRFEPDDNGTLLVTCPVLPEVTTYGANRSDACRRGREAVEEALGAHIARWEPIPVPGDDVQPTDGGAIVALSSLASHKALLFMACQESGTTRADLTRALGWHREQVDRLFRFDHATRHEQFDAAFEAIGRHVRMDLEGAAA